MAKSPKGKKGKKSIAKVTEDKAKAGKVKEDKVKEDQEKEEPAKGDIQAEKPEKGDHPKGDQPKEDQPKGDQPKGDTKEVSEEKAEEKNDQIKEDQRPDDKSAETKTSTDAIKKDVPIETNDRDGVTEGAPMESKDGSNKSSNKETVSSDEVKNSEKEDSTNVNKKTVKNDDKKTDESNTLCTELNDSVIICENDKKDESSEILSTDVSEVDKSFEEISEGEVMSTNEIEEAATATQITSQDEQTVEEGEEWTLESRLESFIRWCRMQGVTLSPKVKVTSEGTCHRYGMVATSEIKKGELLFTVPRALTLHPDNSRIVAEIVDYEDWLDSIGQSLDDSSGWATLLIALMLEFNDKDSYWAPYLRLVPKPEDFGHPLFWTPDEHKDELRGTTLLYDIQRDVYNIESEYKQFILPFIYRYKDICGRTERYNLSLYKRLVAFVMAYSFTEDFDSQPGMVPLADILNHSVNNNAYLIFGEDELKMVALKKIDKGEEIFNTFGKLGNSELLQMYGYADAEPNIFDSLPILVNTFFDAMEKQEKVIDSVFQAKVSLLNKTEIAPTDDFFLFDRNGMRKGPDFVQMLKILFMPDTEFEELLKLRAGNRPDSFYQKLLRKLKLARKTDTSSGVAIIDITDEEPEIEAPPKRKIVDLHEIDDNEPPCKQGRGGGEMHMMYLQLAHNHPEQSFPLNMLQNQYTTYENKPPSNGNSKSNAIVIDDSDEEGDTGEVDPKPKETEATDSVEEKNDEKSLQMSSEIDSATKDADKEAHCKADKKTEISSVVKDAGDDSTPCSSKNDSKDKTATEEGDEALDSVPETMEKDTSGEKNSEKDTSEKDTAEKKEISEEETLKEKAKSDSLVDASSDGNDTKNDSGKKDVSKDEPAICISGEIKEGTIIDHDADKSNKDKDDVETKSKELMDADSTEIVTGDNDKVEPSDSKSEKVSSSVDKKVNGDISDVVSIGDDIEDDLGEDVDDDVDDIEIVSEDIRCKITYANLDKELKPEWKEFIKSVLTEQVASLKPDEDMTTSEARAKMSDRAFYAYQIRQGQRAIVKTFISSLAT